MLTWFWLYKHHSQLSHEVYYDVLTTTFWFFFSFFFWSSLIPYCFLYFKLSPNCINFPTCSYTLEIISVSSSWRNLSWNLLNGSDLDGFSLELYTAAILGLSFLHTYSLCIFSYLWFCVSSSFLVNFLVLLKHRPSLSEWLYSTLILDWQFGWHRIPSSKAFSPVIWKHCSIVFWFPI